MRLLVGALVGWVLAGGAGKWGFCTTCNPWRIVWQEISAHQSQAHTMPGRGFDSDPAWHYAQGRPKTIQELRLQVREGTGWAGTTGFPEN